MSNVNEVNSLGKVVQLDDGGAQSHLDKMALDTVEETLNHMLDAEADAMCGAQRYERSLIVSIPAQAVMSGSFIAGLVK